MALEQVLRTLQEQAGNGDGTPQPSQRREVLQQWAHQIRHRLVETAELDPNSPDARTKAKSLVQRYLEEAEGLDRLLVLAPFERAEIEDRILTSIFGYSVLTPFIADPAVTEIMVNGLDRIFIERNGEVIRQYDREGAPLAFQDRAEVLAVVEKIVAPLNRKVDESDPIVDARLPDGSRVSIVLPPVALEGATITIRKFPRAPYSLEDLVLRGALPVELMSLLHDLVRARVNVVVSGGTASGKTTFLNALGLLIPAKERVVTVEDAAELRLTHVENLVRMEARPANIEGKGQINIRDLVKTSLRMRPDRIIVGEVRGGECLDMLQAMNTGHDGSLTTAHANSARDLISRLETMVLMSGLELPISAIRQQIASAIEVIIHLARLSDGTRRVVEVAEVRGIDHGEVDVCDLFRWDAGAGEDGAGDLVWTGQPLTRTGKFALAGVAVPQLGEVTI